MYSKTGIQLGAGFFALARPAANHALRRPKFQGRRFANTNPHTTLAQRVYI